MPEITTVAEAWLALLKARGVDFLFGTAGTDFAPIIEALARGETAGLAMPEPVTVSHEHVAVSLAHGFYLATGRPQAVMVHVNVGTANALMALLNAARDRVPVIFTAGRSPVTEDGLFGARDLPIHWGQDMRDQAGLVRAAAKWTADLVYPPQLPTLVDRALAIACSPPPGPVYVTLPREALAMPIHGFRLGPPSQVAASPPAPDPATVERIADLFVAAKHPLLIAARHAGGGRSASELAEFAEQFAVPVVEFWPSRLSLPTTHPLHGGFDPGPWFAEADLILVLDALVPWTAQSGRPKPGVPVVTIGCDPLFVDTPLRGHQSDIALLAETTLALRALTAALSPKLRGQSQRLRERLKRLKAHCAELRCSRLAQARAATGRPIAKNFLSLCLSDLAPPDAVIINELGCLPEAMQFARAGSYFSHSLAGGLGWGLPCALGYRLGDPQATVIATVGDGSYIFANPVACHQCAAALNVPILTIIANNRAWATVRQTTALLYPDGYAVRKIQMPFTALAPAPDYSRIVEACGGYGERVEEPAALRPALARALRILREEKRQVVLEVLTGEPE